MSDSVPQVAKIKLKVGSMELEYEGDPSFLTGGIEALLVTMGGLVGKVPDDPPPAPEPTAQVPPAKQQRSCCLQLHRAMPSSQATDFAR